MVRAVLWRTACVLLVAGVGLNFGCGSRQTTQCPTLASAGINTRDVIDLPAQQEQERLFNVGKFEQVAIQIKEQVKAKAPPGRPERNILCLSGGGSFGAYTAGVLYGWSERGDRPTFDVVTGISTGALIAPLAFLGPKYDPLLKEYYTTVENKDIYKLHLVRGLLGESLADNSPLGRQIDKVLKPEIIAEVAEAHRQGRRLYIGTTEEEGKRFIIWDLGAIACRNGPGDLELIRQILLGSSAIPGFFPASKINVSVDGRCYTEKHSDGGVSQAIFMRMPYVLAEQQNDPVATNHAGTKVWAIVAGKIYADPEVVKERSLYNATKSISAMIAAQTRGDLQRMYLLCMVNGMDLSISAIPAEYPAPLDATEFKPVVMSGLFEEGRRVVHSSQPWRTTPPGALKEEGEILQARTGRDLTYLQRGPLLPIHAPHDRVIPPFVPLSNDGIPVVPPAPE